MPRQCCRTWYFLDSSNCQSDSRAVRFIFSHSFLSTCQSTCRFLERWFLEHEWTNFDALDYYVLQGANESTQQKPTSSKQNMQGLCTWCTCPLTQSQSGNFIMLPSLVQTQMLELIAAMPINIYKQKNLTWSLKHVSTLPRSQQLYPMIRELFPDVNWHVHLQIGPLSFIHADAKSLLKLFKKFIW